MGVLLSRYLTFYPITLAHEGGHMLNNLVLQRGNDGWKLNDDATAETAFKNAGNWFVENIGSFIGYATPPLLGVAAAALIAAGNPWAVLLASIFLSVLAAALSRNALAFLVPALIVLGFTWLLLTGSAALQAGFAVGTAWLLLFGDLRQAVMHFPSEDGAKLMSRTWMPNLVWTALWLFIAVVALIVGGQLLLRPGYAIGEGTPRMRASAAPAMIPGMARQDRLRRISQAHDRRRSGRGMRLWRKLAVWLLYPRRDRGFWYGFAIDVLWPVLMAVARWDFRGGRQVPTSGGALLAVNHLSHVDPIVLVTYVMAQGRVPRFLAMKELWGMTVVGAPLRGGRHIPVDRRASGVEAYRAAVEAVRRGEVVVLYPEGGFDAHSDGWPRAARSGVARIALETGAPVVPVAQWGSNHLLPPAATRPTLVPRATLQVLAGPPVALDDLRAGRIGRRALHEATDRIMGRITEQLAVLRGEEPPARPEPRDARDAADPVEPAVG